MESEGQVCLNFTCVSLREAAWHCTVPQIPAVALNCCASGLLVCERCKTVGCYRD